MTEFLTSFLSACQKVCDELTLMTSLEQDKRQALLGNDVKAIEQITNKQQALSMKLENAEKKRVSAQIACGFENKTSRDILNELSAEDKKVFSPVFEKLYNTADILKITNKASLDIVAIELSLLKDRLPATETNFAQPGKRGYSTYTKPTFQGTF
ncbi:MAG: flagellar export chaperone FlgN [Clostridia bacterium]